MMVNLIKIWVIMMSQVIDKKIKKSIFLPKELAQIVDNMEKI